MKKGFMVAAAVAAAAGLPAAAWADEGVVVVRDAQTGALRAPTAAEAAALRKDGDARRAESLRAAPQVRSLPGGGIGAKVPEGLMMYSVVQKRPDGTLDRQCIQGDEQAQAAALPAFAERIKLTSTARTVRGMAYEEQ